MIMGLGLSGGAWWRTVPVLSRRLQVITFDNRGVGRSARVAARDTTEAMADDARAVLDAAGIERAHVYGFSLGGMVAQQLALRHPSRVRSLVLGATQAGGPDAVTPDPDVFDFLRHRLAMRQEEGASPRCRSTTGSAVRAEPSRADRRGHPAASRPAVPAAGLSCATGGPATLHNCHRRLRRITAPTLVVHGRHDRMFPVRECALVADGIPEPRCASSTSPVTCIRPRSPRSSPPSRTSSWAAR